MIRLFKIEDPRQYKDFANDLFSGGARIQQFDFANDAVQISDTWYRLSSAVILKNEDTAKPLALNVVNEWVDLSNLSNIGQKHDLGVGAVVKTDTTNNTTGDRNEFRMLKGYVEIEIDTTIQDNTIQLLPQIDKGSFLIDNLSWVRTHRAGVSGDVGNIDFSQIDGDGPEGFPISVYNQLEVFTLYLPTGYNQKNSIDLNDAPWTATITTATTFDEHKIKLFIEGKLFSYTS